eukprot:430212_1
MSTFALSVLGLMTICTSHRNDYTKEASGDQITNLPGLDAAILAKYNMFSGYIDVYPAHNKSIHYWFVESLNNPLTDPIAIWTNGGPGASGMIGFFTEQGPFRPLKNLSLMVNPYSWVNIMSMIFIETPAGVGFSFSNDTTDYTIGDNQTAIDNYNFVLGWLNKYPNYQSNDFYITSESYGGHYMTTLAKQIIMGNNADNKPQINFKGIFVGNPATDIHENQRGRQNTKYGHQMVSQPLWEAWYKACKNGNISFHQNTDCNNAKIALNNAMSSNINQYALDYPVCESESKYNEVYLFFKHMAKAGDIVPNFYQRMISYFEKHTQEQFYADPDRRKVDKLKSFPDSEDKIPYEPCSENYMIAYLNQISVQQAIHVINKTWPGTLVNYNMTDNDSPMEETWKWVIANDPLLHITIVSGDNDAVCPPLGTQSWIWEMGWTVDPK